VFCDRFFQCISSDVIIDRSIVIISDLTNLYHRESSRDLTNIWTQILWFLFNCYI